MLFLAYDLSRSSFAGCMGPSAVSSTGFQTMCTMCVRPRPSYISQSMMGVTQISHTITRLQIVHAKSYLSWSWVMKTNDLQTYIKISINCVVAANYMSFFNWNKITMMILLGSFTSCSHTKVSKKCYENINKQKTY